MNYKKINKLFVTAYIKRDIYLLMPAYHDLVRLYEQDMMKHKYFTEPVIDDVMPEFDYIHSKWNAPHRLRWIIQVLNPAYYPFSDYYKNKRQAMKYIKKIPGAIF